MTIKSVGILFFSLFAGLWSGCYHYGITAKTYPPAQGPQGAIMQVTTDNRQFSGELIEVRDTGLVIYAEQLLRLAPYNTIVSSHIDNTSRHFGIGNRKAPPVDVREHLRLLSRFPRGLSPELLEQLLRAYGQKQLWDVSREQDDSRDAFIEKAREGTEKYHEQATAIADGYRRIGRDFPGMGEHWINVGLVNDGRIDPASPEFLTYIVVAGAPLLAGVAYALPLLPGESAPDWPAGKAAWHDHFRTVEDETVLPHHHSPAGAGNSARLTMLHAWIWLENPDGVWAPDNWSIPYARLGLVPPAGSNEAAAKAVSLVTGGEEYFLMSAEAAQMNKAERLRLEAAFARSRTAVELILRDCGQSGLSPGDLDKLSNVWTGIRSTIAASTSSKR